MTVNILTAQHVRAIKEKLSPNGTLLKTKQGTESVWVINQNFTYRLVLKNQGDKINVIAHFPKTEEFRERIVDVAEIHVNQGTGEFIAASDSDSNFSILDTKDIEDAIYSAFFTESAT